LIPLTATLSPVKGKKGTRRAASRSVSACSVDHFFERDIGLAFAAANQADLFQVVLGLEQIALLSVPHAVIGPRHGVIWIRGENK
jgi:hypothetical protein